MERVNHEFVSRRGNRVVVVNVREVSRAGFWSGFGPAVRTFARVNGVEVPVPAGCSFEAPRCVEAAGF